MWRRFLSSFHQEFIRALTLIASGFIEGATKFFSAFVIIFFVAGASSIAEIATQFQVNRAWDEFIDRLPTAQAETPQIVGPKQVFASLTSLEEADFRLIKAGQVSACELVECGQMTENDARSLASEAMDFRANTGDLFDVIWERFFDIVTFAIAVYAVFHPSVMAWRARRRGNVNDTT